MQINYTLSAIMRKAHDIASRTRCEFDTYKEALSRGLKKAWAIAKGILPNVAVESAKVVHDDVQISWVYQCLGEVTTCESTV